MPSIIIIVVIIVVYFYYNFVIMSTSIAVCLHVLMPLNCLSIHIVAVSYTEREV